ncbi:MAG: hypothetical protein QM784_12630 [Polyangiaceae bacterium]
MRPLDPMKLMRVSTALATGLFTGTVLVASAHAQTAANPPAAAAPKAAEAKPAAPTQTPAPAATPTPAKPADAGSAPAAATQPSSGTAATNPSTTAPSNAPATTPSAATKDAKAIGAKPAAGAKPADVKPAEVKGPDKKTKDLARKAYNDGTQAFKGGKYDAALLKFQEAESLIPSANAEYWIAASYDKLDRQVEALAAYATYLAGPEAAKAGEDKLAEAKARYDHLRATVPGEIVLTAVPTEAQISIDGQAHPDKSPLSLKLTPGDHKNPRDPRRVSPGRANHRRRGRPKSGASNRASGAPAATTASSAARRRSPSTASSTAAAAAEEPRASVRHARDRRRGRGRGHVLRDPRAVRQERLQRQAHGLEGR